MLPPSLIKGGGGWVELTQWVKTISLCLGLTADRLQLALGWPFLPFWHKWTYKPAR